MTINRRELFIEAWSVARKFAREGECLRKVFKRALVVTWATFKEEVRRAALPVQTNAWTQGAPLVMRGGNHRAAYLMAPYNGW